MLLWDFIADRDTPARKKLIADLKVDLQIRLSDQARVIDSFSERELYSRDLGDLPKWIEKAFFRTTPHLVLQPIDATQVAIILKFSVEKNLPIIPRGIASTAFGGPVPTKNGLVIDFSPMKKIGSISVGADPTITVQAGTRFGDIEDFIQPYGYTLAVYPSNRLGTIGGWLSSGGYGMNALKYGHVREWIASIEVVTMDGSIRWLKNGEPDFDAFIGTEGQMGIVTQVMLRLLPRPEVRVPHLLGFDSAKAAFDFANEIYARDSVPATITYLSSELLRLLNQLHEIDHHDSLSREAGEGQGGGSYLTERHSLLVYCDDQLTEDALQSALKDRSDITQADRERAGHIWADRYFPMKIRRLGPSLLAGQVVLPLEDTSAYLDEANRLAAKWGLTLATEAHILPPAPTLPPSSTREGSNSLSREAGEGQGGGSGLRTLTMPMFLTDQHRASYAAHFVFVSMLDRLGGKHHGQPYNLGIWHVPFANEKYSQDRWKELQSIKRRLDPRNLLNPGKFPRVRSRFFGLTGLLLQSWVFKFGMDFFRVLTPLVRLFTKGKGREARGEWQATSGKLQDMPLITQRSSLITNYSPRFTVSPIPLTFETPPTAELSLTAAECTSCGNCISVCPAYLETHDERTTARGKLWLARRVAEGKTIDQDESDMAFMCLRCRACAEVCQAQLPLMDAWEQLESMLAAQYDRPDEKIKTFLTDVERNPEYLQFVGLKRPGNILTQKWLTTEIIPLEVGKVQGARGESETARRRDGEKDLSKHPERRHESVGVMSQSKDAISDTRYAINESAAEEEYAEPTNIHHSGGKYHINTHATPSIAVPLGKFNIERSDFCINCGQCAEACVYGVHQRSEFDIRRMNAPEDQFCRACFRCIQECPRQALSISIDATYSTHGRAPFTADILSSLARQADEGRIPVTGAGYRGKFGGEGFDGMWTDMSEIVRPTRDGIHGREYISTAIDLGRRSSRVLLNDQGQLAIDQAASLEIPIPIVFQLPTIHADVIKVGMSIRHAARQLGTIVLDQSTHSEKLIQLDDSASLMEEIKHIKAGHADTVIVVRLALRKDVADRVEQLTRSGAEVIHLAANWDGSTEDGSTLFDALPIVHQQLVAANIRDEVTLLASGGIASAEHLPKTIILGADGVVIDLPLLAALECPLLDGCFEGHDCTTPLNSIEVKWGRQRIVNLMAAWRNQLLEVMGAMGMREVRRLRGERGRAMFANELEEKLFEPLFLMSNE